MSPLASLRGKLIQAMTSNPPTSSRTADASGSLPNPIDPALPLQIVRVEWDSHGRAAEVRVRQGDKPSLTVPAEGLHLSYRIAASGQVRCVGRPGFRADEPGYVDCDNPPQRPGRICARCSIIEAGFASSLHHAHNRSANSIDRDVASHLNRPNALYLAGFRDGSIKVGTSTLPRRDRRWAEQGAWRARQVAEAADGIIVREIEDAVTATLGLAQSVSAVRKVAGHLKPIAEEALEATLDHWTEAVHRLLSAVPDLAADVTAATGITPTDESWSFPGGDESVWHTLYAYSPPLSQASHNLIIERLCGRIALFTKPGSQDVFVADIGQLYGRVLELGDVEPNDVLVQDSLF